MPTIDPDRLAAFERLHLRSGGHCAPPPDCGDPELCAMEARAWLRAEHHTDQHPSAVLGAFMRGWNDGLRDEQRDLLKPLVLEIAQADLVVTPEAEQVRGLLVADWYCREWTPTWLEVARLTEPAAALRAFRPLLTWDDVAAIEPLLRSAWAAARAAAGAAAGAAARAAAWDAAWAAARAALAPTVAQLQQSAMALVRRMIVVEG